MKTTTPQPIHLSDYTPSDYLVDTIELDVHLDPENTLVNSKLKIRRNPITLKSGTSRAQPALQLDGEDLHLNFVLLSGKKLPRNQYKLTKTGLKILRPPQKPFTLEISVSLNPSANKSLSGLYLSRDIYCSQCEAEGFRRITYSLDRPDILSVYTTRIEAKSKQTPVLLSNGNLVKKGRMKGTGRHFVIWHDPHPKPSYLFAIVGGKLELVKDKFVTSSGRDVELCIYVEPGKKDRCNWAMQSLKKSMRWDEKRFGREYDLNRFMIVAVSDFNMGAMENKGLNIFNDKLVLARPDTATDSDYVAIESVIAHEYFHNWTGNRITCRDWFQLCLKEGLTVFRDQEFSADIRSRTVQRIQDVRMLKAHQFPEDAGPLAHPVRPSSFIEINNFYTATVYEKGAELCRMLYVLAGKTGFRKGMDLYFDRHDGEAAKVEDFLTAIADANQIDLNQFMNWYEQAGTPELVCDFRYQPRRQTAELTVNQITRRIRGQKNNKPLLIPLKIGLLAEDGRELELRLTSDKIVTDGLLTITKRRQTFEFTNVPTKPRISILRDFSAPVNITLPQSERDIEFLARNDTNLFNRWQAIQSYAIETLIQITNSIKSGKHSARGSRFVTSLGGILSQRGKELEPAYRAECLKLPSETDIAREMKKNIDPDAIHKARQRLLNMISRDLSQSLLKVYKENQVKGRYSPSANAVGKRSYRNTALYLLAQRQSPADIKRVYRHYNEAGNMTDRIAALTILANLNFPEREEVLADFYQYWKDDHLVIDKWFAIQATSALPDTLEQVQELMTHPLFSLNNPNKVRALIGSFAQANPVNFNRADGKGYELVANTVLNIDRFNPQVAARLANCFRSWRILEPRRSQLAKNILESMLREKRLSRNSFEIITKILG